MKMIFHLAWIMALLTSASMAGGEKKLQQLLAEGYEFKTANERFMVVQMDSGILSQDSGAFLCPVDHTQVLQSLREATCEPIHKRSSK